MFIVLDLSAFDLFAYVEGPKQDFNISTSAFACNLRYLAPPSGYISTLHQCFFCYYCYLIF